MSDELRGGWVLYGISWDLENTIIAKMLECFVPVVNVVELHKLCKIRQNIIRYCKCTLSSLNLRILQEDK